MKYILIILLFISYLKTDGQYSISRIDNNGENYKDTVLIKDGTDSLFRLFEGEYIFAGTIRRRVFINASEVANLTQVLSVFPTTTDLTNGLAAKQDALGFTPYNATNPNGYISSITGVNVTTALGYTPYNATNPNGYISAVPAQTFASLTGKPTTLAGYGITDAYPLAGNPSSFLVAADIVGKQNTLVSGTNIKTVNGNTLLGSGDVVISGDGITRTFLPNDVANANAVANTIADVTGLSFNVVANTTYYFRFFIVYSAAATTTGSRWSINGPATTFMNYTSEYTLTATSITNNQGLAGYNVPAGASASSLTTGNICIIEGIIRPSANGTVTARFASEISASAITAIASGRSYVESKIIN